MRLRVIVKPVQYRDTWRVYCPMMGEDLGRGTFESEEEARHAAESLGFKVIDDDELEDVGRLTFNGHDYTSLRWFIANSDMTAITKGYASVRLYEARIKVCERDGNDALKYTYEGLIVATSVMLERIANDFNGRYYPHFQWTNLAQWENERARLHGMERITTEEGTCELI